MAINQVYKSGSMEGLSKAADLDIHKTLGPDNKLGSVSEGYLAFRGGFDRHL